MARLLKTRAEGGQDWLPMVSCRAMQLHCLLHMTLMAVHVGEEYFKLPYPAAKSDFIRYAAPWQSYLTVDSAVMMGPCRYQPLCLG